MHWFLPILFSSGQKEGLFRTGPSESAMEPQAAKLCKRCRLLEFNDEKEGGEIAVTANGAQYLTLPTRWYTRSENDPGFWVIDVPREDIDSDESMFKDTLPSLPGLEASARNGCEFCALLRNTILAQANDEKVDPVEGTRSYLSQESPCLFSMYWMWFNESVEKYGLPLGLLCLKVDIRTPGRDLVTVTFRAEAIDRPIDRGMIPAIHEEER